MGFKHPMMGPPPAWLSTRGYGVCAQCGNAWTTQSVCSDCQEEAAARKDETAYRRTAPRGTWS